MSRFQLLSFYATLALYGHNQHCGFIIRYMQNENQDHPLSPTHSFIHSEFEGVRIVVTSLRNIAKNMLLASWAKSHNRRHFLVQEAFVSPCIQYRNFFQRYTFETFIFAKPDPNSTLMPRSKAIKERKKKALDDFLHFRGTFRTFQVRRLLHFKMANKDMSEVVFRYLNAFYTHKKKEETMGIFHSPFQH